ncbi:uncharacterized protein BJ212DRAFT_1347653 [Suillus subaureus]|uniref:Uncharacterized protein n=1 Tax=Suillus subaureus TaxID=48587 RepID=A0A9P7JEE9_9AGAM|nr:uncharacterized protein BJ212DRAFT_1347653 [Suillus subaureus]KAG1817928.1 hypothetical protein BJ212DRAFT_1347653 [Suillus subaureus]
MTSVFNHRFLAVNTEVYLLALFLHPMCRKLAVMQVANGRSFELMVKVALFAGGQADGLRKSCGGWEVHPLSTCSHAHS